MKALTGGAVSDYHTKQLTGGAVSDYHTKQLTGGAVSDYYDSAKWNRFAEVACS